MRAFRSESETYRVDAPSAVGGVPDEPSSLRGLGSIVLPRKSTAPPSKSPNDADFVCCGAGAATGGACWRAASGRGPLSSLRDGRGPRSSRRGDWSSRRGGCDCSRGGTGFPVARLSEGNGASRRGGRPTSLRGAPSSRGAYAGIIGSRHFAIAASTSARGFAYMVREYSTTSLRVLCSCLGGVSIVMAENA